MSRRLRLTLAVSGLLLTVAAIVIWPLGFRKTLRSWWYWRHGPSPGRFQDPEGLAVDSRGRLYIGDEKRSQVLVFDAAGLLLKTIAPTAGNRMAVAGSDHLFLIGERDGVDVIAEVDPETGRELRWFTAPPAAGGPRFAPEGLAFDPTSRELYVADEDARRIVVFDNAGRVARTFPVDHEPECVLLLDDLLYVTMPKAGWVSCYGKDGHYRFRFGRRELVQPESVAASPDRRLYVSDHRGHKIGVFDLQGAHLFTIGGPGSEPGRFRRPQDLAFTPEGHLVVADSDNHRVQLLSPSGVPLRVIE